MLAPQEPLDLRTITVVLKEMCERREQYVAKKVRGLRGLDMAISYLRHKQLEIENMERDRRRQRDFDARFAQRRLEGI